MTAGSNGVPEDDDPFAYLYRPAGGEASQPGSGQAAPMAAPQPGVPRTSYAKPTRVGSAQYGQQRSAQPSYGQQVPPQQVAPYAQHSRPQPGADAYGRRSAGRGSGGRSRAVAFGAIAVVAAVVIGAGVALMNGHNGAAQAAVGSSVSPTAGSGASSSASADASSGSPSASAPTATDAQSDASKLTLSGPAAAKSGNQPRSSDGRYVDMSTAGAVVSWQVEAPADGQYKVYLDFANAAGDATAVIAVDGKATTSPINLKNYSSSNKWDQWYFSWVNATLKKGSNTITVSHTPSDPGAFYLARVAVVPDGQRPSGWSVTS